MKQMVQDQLTYTPAMIGVGAISKLIPYYLESHPAKAAVLVLESDPNVDEENRLNKAFESTPSLLEDCDATMLPMLVAYHDSTSMEAAKSLQNRFKCDLVDLSLEKESVAHQRIVTWMESNIF